MFSTRFLAFAGLFVGLLSWGAPASVASEKAAAAAVTVIGCVRLQGAQEMPDAKPYRLSDAIGKAGGFNKWANGRKVEVTRRGADGQKVKRVADVISILKEGRPENDFELQAGDVVKVPERYFNL